jgi:hypothetical protein
MRRIYFVLGSVSVGCGTIAAVICAVQGLNYIAYTLSASLVSFGLVLLAAGYRGFRGDWALPVGAALLVYASWDGCYLFDQWRDILQNMGDLIGLGLAATGGILLLRTAKRFHAMTRPACHPKGDRG